MDNASDPFAVVFFRNSLIPVSWIYETETVGERNLPPPNASMACGLFQAENNQGPKDSGRNFELPHNCLKKLGRGPITGIKLSPETSAVNMD